MHLGKEKWPPMKRFPLLNGSVRALRIRALRTPLFPVRESKGQANGLSVKPEKTEIRSPGCTLGRHAIMNGTGLSRHNRATNACWARPFQNMGTFHWAST